MTNEELFKEIEKVGEKIREKVVEMECLRARERELIGELRRREEQEA